MAAKTIAQEYGRPAWMAMVFGERASMRQRPGNRGGERGEVLFGGLMFAHLQLMALSCLGASSWWCRSSFGFGHVFGAWGGFHVGNAARMAVVSRVGCARWQATR
ncbi:hypothetical protein B0T18DRAFT_403487 [Schizothecium vesticola]|uniref:Uncharacterized protein n=1 Tax=Schizothecium vesticola TaxID=314040 RepID=A0AA40KAK2_9PEZI|nr:hypothetical protein B0T18DRAFT_403487 [Schizothecium vesticola]